MKKVLKMNWKVIAVKMQCLLLGLLITFAFDFAAFGQKKPARDYDKAELSAPQPIKQKLADLRKNKALSFEIKYTSALDRPLESLAGTKAPSNLLQEIKSRNALALIDIQKLKLPIILKPTCKANEASFDWRTRGAVTPIKDQENCGSCWDFGTHAAMESSWFLVNNALINTSEQSTLDCISSGSCGGGWPSNAATYLMNPGTCLTSAYPYTAVKGTCKKTTDSYKLYSWGYVGADNNIPSVSAIKAALCQYGPLVTTVYAGSSAFQSYGGGVFNEHATNGIDHCVCIIGWDDKQQAWLIKNSWGTDWGSNCGYGTERGFMWISYTSNSIGYATMWVVALRQ